MQNIKNDQGMNIPVERLPFGGGSGAGYQEYLRTFPAQGVHISDVGQDGDYGTGYYDF